MAASGDAIWSAVLNSARVGGTAVLGWLATVVLIPVVLFYLLLDWHAMLARIAGACRAATSRPPWAWRRKSTPCWPSTCAASCW
jgi:predicted PurR-regulated permease PerM